MELGNHARIEGDPSVDITIREEISQKGGLGTAGVTVNMIPGVIETSLGFHTMNNLVLPHIWSGGPEPQAIEKIVRS